MKKLLTLSLFSFLFFFGCNQDSEITSPETSQVSPLQNQQDFTKQSNIKTLDLSHKQWIELRGKNSKPIQRDDLISESELIWRDQGGSVFLYREIEVEDDDELIIEALLTIPPFTFNDGKSKVFTLSQDTETATSVIDPSPKTLQKTIILDLEYRGLDLAGINPDSVEFCVENIFGDKVPVEYNELIVIIGEDDGESLLKVVGAKIHAFFQLPPSRYGWIR